MLKKNSKTKALITALVAVLILSIGLTTAYLSDFSDEWENRFNPNWVKVDMEESGTQQYDIVPGTEETKDPKVKVNNSTEAYVYLIVTDNVNAGREENPLVSYDIDSNWKEIPKADLEGQTLTDGDGNEITLGENDRIYYQLAPASATGEDDEIKGDFEITYPVLVGDKVSYSSTLTNDDLDALEDDGIKNILGFRAYAIQKKGFEDPIKALTAKDTSKENAKGSLAKLICGEPSQEEQDALTKWQDEIDKAATIAEVEADYKCGKEAIEDAHKEHAEVTISYISSDSEKGSVDNPSETISEFYGVAEGTTAIPKDGYKFRNWTDSNGKEVKKSSTFVPGKVNGKNIETEYTANFEPIKYRVHFDENRPLMPGEIKPGDSELSYDETVILPEMNDNKLYHLYPGPTSYFLNWNTKADGTGESFAAGVGVSNLSSIDGEIVTLYAQWEKECYISYVAENGEKKIELGLGEYVRPKTGRARGETAFFDDGYRFINWTDSHGNIVGTEETFVPEKGEDGEYHGDTYTAHFEKQKPIEIIPVP